MYAVYVSILGGIFFRNNHNWADGKLHSLQKNNIKPQLSFQRSVSTALFLVYASVGYSL